MMTVKVDWRARIQALLVAGLSEVYGPARPDVVTPCWGWTGRRDRDGYGKLWVGWRNERVHRLAYLLWCGPLDEVEQVQHRCDFRSCARPDHLKPGNHASNAADASERHRWPYPEVAKAKAAKTHCPKGHALVGENLYVTTKGWRVCRTCARRPRSLVRRR